MKFIFVFISLTCAAVDSYCQRPVIDSLIGVIKKTPKDTNDVKLLLEISGRLYFQSPLKSLEYSSQALDLSRKLGYRKGIARSLNLAGESHRLSGNYPEALRFQIEAREIYKASKDSYGESGSLGFIGICYFDLSEYRQAIYYLLLAEQLQKNRRLEEKDVFRLVNIGNSYHYLDIQDSALYYLRIASVANISLNHPQLQSNILRSIGRVYAKIGIADSAFLYYHKALHNSLTTNESINLGQIYHHLGSFYYDQQRYDSGLFYARKAFEVSQRTSQKPRILESSSLLVKLLRVLGQFDSAFYFEDIYAAMKDSLYGNEKIRKLQLLRVEETQKQLEVQQAQVAYRNRAKMIAIWSAAGVVVIIAIVLYRSNRQQKKANIILTNTLNDLRSTQQQLIQSEKMASLGELTAGIAHEIQNPLNFVNNFSEVNKELADELKAELETGNTQLASEIADDIKDNSEKINHHGKRADAIVKGMLQHSRSSSGQKEPTDINALCDEYLRLAYHGLRAKDKSFNATMKSDFDETIGNINIVPQDIGRVILNLINNAFYAVNEKAKSSMLNAEGYEPTVTISTRRENNKIEIKVADNGNGIPKSIKEKIFQPFFTTKPTGQGTGLGLSLSYDIIKAHSGEIKVETKEGEGTEFIIQLQIH